MKLTPDLHGPELQVFANSRPIVNPAILIAALGIVLIISASLTGCLNNANSAGGASPSISTGAPDDPKGSSTTGSVSQATSSDPINAETLQGFSATQFALSTHTHTGLEITSEVAECTHTKNADLATKATQANTADNSLLFAGLPPDAFAQAGHSHGPATDLICTNCVDTPDIRQNAVIPSKVAPGTTNTVLKTGAAQDVSWDKISFQEIKPGQLNSVLTTNQAGQVLWSPQVTTPKVYGKYELSLGFEIPTNVATPVEFNTVRFDSGIWPSGSVKNKDFTIPTSGIYHIIIDTQIAETTNQALVGLRRVYLIKNRNNQQTLRYDVNLSVSPSSSYHIHHAVDTYAIAGDTFTLSIFQSSGQSIWLDPSASSLSIRWVSPL